MPNISIAMLHKSITMRQKHSLHFQNNASQNHCNVLQKHCNAPALYSRKENQSILTQPCFEIYTMFYCFFYGSIGSCGHKTAACQPGMLGETFLSALIQDCRQKDKINHTISLNWSVSRILLLNNMFSTMGKSNILFLGVVCVLIMNKTSYHPWVISARGCKIKGQRTISGSIYDFWTNKGRNKCNPLFYVILSC